jgi:3-oxoacyl-[acyl-carrier protein] reductase
MDLGIAGRACVVTGASRGIGAATAQLLADEGAFVLLVARDADALAEAAGACAGNVETLALDIADADAGARVRAAGEGAFGAIDMLVNNAGTSRNRPLEELTDADWQEQWELNVLGPMRLMRELAPPMAERGWGRIVNVSSSSGKRPSGTNIAYSTTKAAQLALSRAFAERFAADGVIVNAVAPGPIDTGLWTEPGGLADQAAAAKGVSREEALALARAKLPRGRFGSAGEVAGVIALLCSERAANVVGSAWSVDGGAVSIIV